MEVNGQLHTLASLTLSSSCLYPPTGESLGAQKPVYMLWKESILPVPGTEPQFLDLPPCSLVTVLAQLSQLICQMTVTVIMRWLHAVQSSLRKWQLFDQSRNSSIWYGTERFITTVIQTCNRSCPQLVHYVGLRNTSCFSVYCWNGKKVHTHKHVVSTVCTRSPFVPDMPWFALCGRWNFLQDMGGGSLDQMKSSLLSFFLYLYLRCKVYSCLVKQTKIIF